MFSGPKRRDFSHPVLGTLELVKGRDGFSWISADLTPHGVSASIRVREGQTPSLEQARFYERWVSTPLDAFRLVEPHIAPQFEAATGSALPPDWRAVLELSGVGVPLDASVQNSWDISFQHKALGWIFTCYFNEEGHDVKVGIDT